MALDLLGEQLRFHLFIAIPCRRVTLRLSINALLTDIWPASSAKSFVFNAYGFGTPVAGGAISLPNVQSAENK